MNYREAWANGEIEAGTLVDLIEELESVCAAHEKHREAATNSSANLDNATQRYIESLEKELAALKAQPSGVVLPERRGESDNPAELMFNRGHDHALSEVARLNQQPASGGDERETIRAVFLRNGFTIKEGQTDLKPYVYAAASELMSIARAALPVREAVADEPTHQMILAGERQWESSGNESPDCAAIYRAMRAASQSPSREGE